MAKKKREGTEETIVVGVRMSKQLKDLAETKAAALNISLGELVRRLISENVGVGLT